MWVRKTEQDYALDNKKRKRQRFNFKRPLYVAIIFWTVGILFAKIGCGSKYSGWRPGVPFSELVSWLQANFVQYFIITCVVLYVLQFIFGAIKLERSNTVICNKCFNPYTKVGITDCQCGGQLEPIEKWKWVE